MRKFIVWLTTVIFLGFASAVKSAPLAVGQAWFDWSGLNISTVDIGYGQPTITWLDSWEGYVEASANEEFQSNTSDLTTSLSVSATQGGASALAIINPSTNSMSVDAETGGVGENYANAYALRHVEFTVSGTGLVVFSVPYHIEVSLYGGEYAEAGSHAELYLSNYYPESYLNNIRESYSYADLYKNLSNDGLGSWSDDGILAVALFFNDGETGYFEASLNSDAYSSSPVPLPSTLLLFGGGFLGLISFRKLKS